MNERSDIDPALLLWLREGPSTMPDRVIDVVADRITRQRQRSARRLDWRRYATIPAFKLAATLVAVAIVAVIGANLSPKGSNAIGGSQPTASPSTANPTVSASPFVIGNCLEAVDICRGALAPGTYTSRSFEAAVTYAVPSGWENNIDRLRAFGLTSVDGYVGLMAGPFLDFADPDCAGRSPAGVGATASGVVATLAGDPRLLVANSQVVMIGGRVGDILDIQIAPSWTESCLSSQGAPAVNVLSTTDDHSGPGFGLGGTERVRLIVLDVGGSVVAISIGVSDAKTDFDAFVAETMPIIERMRFGS